MRGTCLECPPQRVGSTKELMTYTFCSDVSHQPQINESAMAVSQIVERLLHSLERHLHHWKRYRPLWEKDKTVVNEMFAAKKPSCAMYDDKLQFFFNIHHDVQREPLFKNEHAIHLNLEPLVHTVQDSAESWIRSLGSFLNKPARENLFNLRDEIMVQILALQIK